MNVIKFKMEKEFRYTRVKIYICKNYEEEEDFINKKLNEI